MIFDDVLKQRRSIRVFTDKPVEYCDICSIVEAARISPSAKNRQPWRFVLLNEKKKPMIAQMRSLAKKQGLNSVLRTADILESAPVVIAVFSRGESYSDLLSIGAAMYGMCLKATDIGIGSLWACDTDILKCYKKYSKLAGVIALGYPLSVPSERKRKSISRVSNLKIEKKESDIEDRIPNADLAGSVPFAFVSYSHKDSNCVRSDIVELKKHGIPLWYDKALFVGEKWDEQALEFVKDEKCRGFVFYISRASLFSDAVYKEFSTAWKNRDTHKICFIPVLIGDVSVSDILVELREKGQDKKAEIYSQFFGEDFNALCIPRDVMPLRLYHIEKVVSSCQSAGIVKNYSVYDVFEYEISHREAIITGYLGTAHDVVIPKSISGYPVVEVGGFAENKNIETVVLPNTVKRLAAGAFRASMLRRIVLPESVKMIGTACFRDCAQLKSIKLPSKITYLSEALFRGCTNLKYVIVHEGVTEMQEAVFRECSSLEEIVMPTTLSRMTEGGFYGCSSLRRLSIPSMVRGAEIQSFDTCPHLERVEVGGFIFENGKGQKI